MIYTVIVEKGRESGYIAYAPALRGCVSQGETREKVLKNIKEAMEVYVEALLEDGLPERIDTGTVDRILEGADLSVGDFVKLLR
jgi:predicted RNase H-like HicB family nuclease